MKKIKISLFILAAISLVGCDDFLDSENLTKKDNSNFPLTPSDATASLAAIYHQMREIYGETFYITSEVLSDDRFGGGGPDDVRMHALDVLKKNSENMFSTVWEKDYAGIYRCNMLMQSIDKISWDSDEQKNKVIGQVYFLRAYFYFELSRFFGDVPLMTSPTQDSNQPRSPAKDVYALIGSDLLTAITAFPSTPYSASDNSELGMATKWAAEALLARVFLFYTGYYESEDMPLTEGTLSKDEVISHLEDCINNSGHGLVSDFRNLWPYTNEYTAQEYQYDIDNNLSWVGEDGGNIETIFAVKYSAKATWDNDTDNNMACLFGSFREPSDWEHIFPFGVGWGIGTVNPKLYNEWPANDLRRDGSIINIEVELPDYEWGCDKQQNETGFMQKKYIAVNAHNSDGESVNFNRLIYPGIDSDYQLNNTQDMVIIRFADVLLMDAELKKDAAPLNKVRARVGLAPVEYSDKALRDERHWELAFEGIRYYDLLRWHIAGDALATQNGVKVKNNLYDATMDFSGIEERIEATGGFMQIPQSQIDLSNGVLTQNPGWGNEAIYN
jgi:hypothetical protein